MQFKPLERRTGEPRTDLTPELIAAMCQRAFGPQVNVLAARELGGGTYNYTWLITLADQKVILRLAPPLSEMHGWDEKRLMRREESIKPYFAAIAHLMPRTLMADFTHQLFPRDYLFQTFLPGERWDAVADTLSPPENETLWNQFGTLLKRIHSTSGTLFGGPYPTRAFSSWSHTIIYRLDHVLQSMTNVRLDTRDMAAVFDSAQARSALLDEIRQPRLLHGDLWLFNLLIERGPAGAHITGVLDADRAWWGDPMADWTMFVLGMSTSPETQAEYKVFWNAYGQPSQTPAAQFRDGIYQAMHIGTALVWATYHQDDATVERGVNDLRAVVARLGELPRS